MSALAWMGLACTLIGAGPLPPAFARIDSFGPTELVLRGKLSRTRQKTATRISRNLYRDVARRFLRPNVSGAKQPVQVVLFESRTRYQRFVEEAFGEGDHSSWGFYVPSRRILVANIGISVGNLRHELTHAILGDDFAACPKAPCTFPSWVNEGMGSLYGNVHRRGTRLGFAVNYRLRDLQAARRAGTLPTFDQLVNADRSSVYGDRAMVYYALARYLLLYLETKQQLTPFYRHLRDEGSSPKAQKAFLDAQVDEDAFLRWTDRLRYPAKRKLPSRSRGP